MLRKPVIILGSPPPTASAPVSVQGTSWPRRASCLLREGWEGGIAENPNSCSSLPPKRTHKTKNFKLTNRNPYPPHPNMPCQKKQINTNWLESSLSFKLKLLKNTVNGERSDKGLLILFYSSLVHTPPVPINPVRTLTHPPQTPGASFLSAARMGTCRNDDIISPSSPRSLLSLTGATGIISYLFSKVVSLTPS